MSRFTLVVCVGLIAACAQPRPVAEETLRGRIVDMYPPSYGTGHQLAKLATPAGRLVLLDLGAPGGEGTIQRGDQVVVTGRHDVLLGERVLVVRTIMEDL